MAAAQPVMTTMRRPELVLAALLGLGLLAPTGCDKQASDTDPPDDCRALSERLAQLEAAKQPEPEPRSTIKVELPPAPAFGAAEAPIQWEDDPDGAYSIYGLRKDMDARLRDGESGQLVVVRGWVQEIYVPPVCPEDELCPPGKQPHIWITDRPDERGKKRAMMVVNYEFPIPAWDTDTQKMWADQPEVTLEVGKQYTFRGRFTRFSDSGFAHDVGLLEFHAYKAPNPDPKSKGELIWVYPPNSDWHPLTIANQEAANEALRERRETSRKNNKAR